LQVTIDNSRDGDQGYDVYFANRIGQDLGVEINYVSTEAANRVE
jgi:polar amino acid transport system substrate-binding protein